MFALNAGVERDRLEQLLSAFSGGSGRFRCLSALCSGGAFALFKKVGDSFLLEEGAEFPGERFRFLEEDPAAWEGVFEEGALQVFPEEGRPIWVAVDRIADPGYLLVAEIPGAEKGVASLLRFALVVDLSGGSVREPGTKELPLWLHPVLRTAAGLESPLLVVAEPGTGQDAFISSLLYLKLGSLSGVEFFSPGRLSEAVQLRELFGDSAGARLGGAGASIPVVARSPRAVVIREAGNLSEQVQLRLLAELDRGGVFWVFETAQDLEGMVQDGVFLPPLYRRLNSSRVVLPPLRFAGEGLREEAARILSDLKRRYGREIEFSDEALDRILSYDWPGNYEELLHVLESSFLLSPGPLLRPEELRFGEWEPLDEPEGLNLRRRTEELERSLILQAFALHGGNQVQMAKVLGISRGSLQYKMQKYRIHERKGE